MVTLLHQSHPLIDGSDQFNPVKRCNKFEPSVLHATESPRFSLLQRDLLYLILHVNVGRDP